MDLTPVLVAVAVVAATIVFIACVAYTVANRRQRAVVRGWGYRLTHRGPRKVHTDVTAGQVAVVHSDTEAARAALQARLAQRAPVGMPDEEVVLLDDQDDDPEPSKP